MTWAKARAVLAASIGIVAVTTLVAIAPPTPPARAQAGNTPKIVNGSSADIANFPWLAAVLASNVTDPRNAQFCAGTLIDPSWVVTAAHCMDGETPSTLQVAFGRTNLSDITPGDRRSISQIAVHPAFTPFDNDIALLKLTTPAVGIPTLPLNNDVAEPALGTAETAAGWGATLPNPAPTSTTSTTIPFFPNGLRQASLLDAAGVAGSCGNYGAEYVAAHMLCSSNTVAEGIVDTCQGDSGGPLVATLGGVQRLVGITSFGNGCAQPNFPGVYTRVSAYTAWVNTYVNAASTQGYRMVSSDGGIFTYGTAPFEGSAGNLPLARPIVGMARTPTNLGYWLVSSDGGIFSFGDATFFGSAGNLRLNKPIVGMSRTPSGNGYWMVATDGGIFSFGDATFHGSTGNLRLNRPIVGMAPTPSGNGYWLVASDGGIFSFGDATFHGSTGNIALNRPIVGMSRTQSGGGYWLVASDGGVFTFGNANFFGSTGSIQLNRPIVGISATESDNGYWMASSDGGIFTFGNAAFVGSAGAVPLQRPIVGMSANG